MFNLIIFLFNIPVFQNNLSFLYHWNGDNFKTMQHPTKREIWFLTLFVFPDLLLLLIRKQTQAPGALFLVQQLPNSVSSISLVPFPRTHALGKAQHFIRKGRKGEWENEKYHEEPTEMLNARYERERKVRKIKIIKKTRGKKPGNKHPKNKDHL